jgi:murein DD-endopeptidase MepM/ murein hydrolase activator NlpD
VPHSQPCCRAPGAAPDPGPGLGRRRFLVGAAATVGALAVPGVLARPAHAVPGDADWPNAPGDMVFPVEGPVRYRNDWGEPRSGGRPHQGNDLFGDKLQRLLAARDAEVTWVVDNAAGAGGNTLRLTDEAGWEYWYMHINDDSPGTNDRANPPEWRFAPGIGLGSKVEAGQHIAYLGDSGNAFGAHLHYEIRHPSGARWNPHPWLVEAEIRRDEADRRRAETRARAEAVASRRARVELAMARDRRTRSFGVPELLLKVGRAVGR